MSVQRQLSILHASPIDQRTALEGMSVGCTSTRMPHRDTVCADGFAATCLSLLRFVAAGYATGEAACWEAAFQLADQAVDAENGPLLVARIATLVRILRRAGVDELACLPAPCNRLTVEEERVILLIEAARQDDHHRLTTALSAVVKPEHHAEAARAAALISDVSLNPALAHLHRSPSVATTMGPTSSLQLDCLRCPAFPLGPPQKIRR
jgi:hypothetical protein